MGNGERIPVRELMGINEVGNKLDRHLLNLSAKGVWCVLFLKQALGGVIDFN